MFTVWNDRGNGKNLGGKFPEVPSGGKMKPFTCVQAQKLYKYVIKRGTFFYLQGWKFLDSCPVPNIFLCWKCQQGSGRCPGKQSPLLCTVSIPSGTLHFHRLHWGCVWHLSYFTGNNNNFSWYGGYCSLKKCSSIIWVERSGCGSRASMQVWKEPQVC